MKIKKSLTQVSGPSGKLQFPVKAILRSHATNPPTERGTSFQDIVFYRTDNEDSAFLSTHQPIQSNPEEARLTASAKLQSFNFQM